MRRSWLRKLTDFVEALFIDMKFTLGLTGVLIVMISVATSIGLFSYFHVKATLIIFEVIPFLVLAVGVDNIFILVQSYQRDQRLPGESLEHQVSRVVGKVGPSMLLTSLAESLAFVLGALTPMPAVKIFSLYAALAVLIDFFLQITCFVSLLTLDCRRELSNRYDLFCCVKGSKASDLDDQRQQDSPVSTSSNASLSQHTYQQPRDQVPDGSLANYQESTKDSGVLHYVFKHYYAPHLMHDFVRLIVLLFFSLCLFISITLVPQVSIGLDQKLSMPKDSYVLDYFESMEKYLSVGVPVYFVVKEGHNYASVSGQNAICSTSGCNPDSLLNQITQATFGANYTHLAVPANSWLDDYFDWLASEDCCRVYKNDTKLFCSSTVANRSDLCIQCPVTNANGTSNRPIETDFYFYLDDYLKDNPNTVCAKGGHAAYGEALEVFRENGKVKRIGSTFFMVTAFPPLFF
jgi:Niemann-Pick C1 protein